MITYTNLHLTHILTGEKKDADKQLEKEVTPGDVSNEEEVSVTTGNQGSGKKSQRKRKSKDFKENYDAEESDNSENDSSGMYCLISVNITNAKYQNQTNYFN